MIELNGEPYFGGSFAAGVYLANIDDARRARRALVERDHLEALRRNDRIDRQRVRFELTPAGAAAIAALRSTTRAVLNIA